MYNITDEQYDAFISKYNDCIDEMADAKAAYDKVQAKVKFKLDQLIFQLKQEAGVPPEQAVVLQGKALVPVEDKNGSISNDT